MLTHRKVADLWQKGKSENGGPCQHCMESVLHYIDFARRVEARVLRNASKEKRFTHTMYGDWLREQAARIERKLKEDR